MPDQRLPIFPLNVVLFPGTTMPLHLFEPRYRQLLKDIQNGDSRFGILTGISGVAERDLPSGRMGCVAEVTEAEVMPDGRANIVVTGRERFALDSFVDDDAPYNVADVSFVADTGGTNAVALAVASDDVAQNFRRVVKAVHLLNGEQSVMPTLPDDPVQLPWSIAAMIDVDLTQRYQLLAERSPAARLSSVDGILKRVLPDLELRAAIAQNNR
ncbi:LON peptidase substrate-binding domain-containing protein [Gemmatimonas sp.]|jgi:Lon protease-like protein|uniref:LON peptidase substrate-binding domain-containing protein n=1 Tax=Gemmatimonas sp. TaxID=1962908 RepID=UPI0037BFE728